MRNRPSGVDRASASQPRERLLLALVIVTAVPVAILAWLWLQCWLVRPHLVQAMFTRIERVSSGIAALRTAQEEHFSIHGSYSRDASLLASAFDPGLSLEILDASATGYAAALRSPAGGIVCEVQLDRNADPPRDLSLECRECVLDELIALRAEPDSITLFKGETARLRANAQGTGAGCEGVLDTLYDWERISPPNFTSADSTVSSILQQRGSDAAIYARAPGRGIVTITTGAMRVEAVVTVLPTHPVDPLTSISAGTPSCALGGTGVLYCWGADLPPGLIGSGIQGYCTGPGDVACSRVPRQTSSPISWRSVTTGTNFVCGIASTGVAWCWGRNDRGQLGNGTKNSTATPAAIAVDRQFVAISAGSRHVCGITSEHTIYCWGANDAGQLGDGTTLDSERPVRVVSDEAFDTVSAGTRHTCAVTTDGRAYCWGSNQFQQLGVAGTEVCVSEFPRQTVNCSQRAHVVATGLRFSSLSAGSRHTCAVTASGEAFCWGANASGEVGDGTRLARMEPTPVSGRMRFLTVSAGAEQSCGLTPSGEAYCWGFIAWADQPSQTPADAGKLPVPVAPGFEFVALDLGDNHVCALTENGRGYCWGRNYQGQLGNGMPDDSSVPTPISGQEEDVPHQR